MKPAYKRNYNPTFHSDGTVTYWRDSFGWAHRVHIATAATIGKNISQENIEKINRTLHYLFEEQK